MIHATDTICAPATSAGMGAIAVIRVSGPDALAAVDKLKHKGEKSGAIEGAIEENKQE